MKKFFIVLFFISTFVVVSQPNPHFNELMGMMNPQQVKYLPFFMIKYSPEYMKSLSKEQLTLLLMDSLNKFIVDSGAVYAKHFVQDEPEKSNFTPETMMSLRRVGSPVISPDGKTALFTIGDVNMEENKTNNDIYSVDLETKVLRPLISSPAADFEATWSPDGKSLAFVSTRDGSPQIYIMNLSDNNLRKISDIPNGASNIGWSPDGKYISYTTDVKTQKVSKDIYPELPKANVRMYNNLPVRHWDHWVDETNSHLFILPANGGESKDLMKGEPYDCPVKPFGGASEIAWSNDGQEIAYTSKKVNNYALTTNSDIFIVKPEGGLAKNITSGLKGTEKDPSYSPDGIWISFLSQEREGFESDRIRLMLYNRKSGKITELSKTVDQWIGSYVWTPDSKFIYFSAEDGPTVQIYRISVPDGKWQVITSGWYNFDGGLQITNDGKKLVFGRRTMMRPHELYSLNIDDMNLVQLTNVNDSKYSNIKPMTITERWVTSTDGKKVHCWVLYPPDFDSTKKYPMITYCQGGPQSTISQYFSYRWNLFLMASQGYIVLAPNRRGMPGFGQAWNDAISKDWGGLPMQDILAATDDMIKEKYVDKKGLSAVGASAGGYAVFWLEGNHQKRFSAFVSHCGVFNFESMYGSTEELWFPNWEYGGPYWDKKHLPFYEKHSPHNYAANWDTPIMISTGEKDFRVPYAQSLEAFTLAQLKGLPSKLITWPNENHWILKPQEQILWYKEFFAWLDKYTKNK